MHGDAAHHDHVVAVVGKTGAQGFGRVDGVTAEQAALPQFAHALGGAAGVRRIRRHAAGAQHVVHRPFEGGGIECTGLRNTGRVFARWRVTGVVTVVAGVGHQLKVAFSSSSVRVQESLSASASYLSGRPNCAA